MAKKDLSGKDRMEVSGEDRCGEVMRSKEVETLRQFSGFWKVQIE